MVTCLVGSGGGAKEVFWDGVMLFSMLLTESFLSSDLGLLVFLVTEG